MATSDLVLAIFIAVVTAFIGLVATMLSLRPPTNRTERISYFVIFIILSFASIGLSVWQSVRASAAQNKAAEEARATERGLSDKLLIADEKLNVIQQLLSTDKSGPVAQAVLKVIQGRPEPGLSNAALRSKTGEIVRRMQSAWEVFNQKNNRLGTKESQLEDATQRASVEARERN